MLFRSLARPALARTVRWLGGALVATLIAGSSGCSDDDYGSSRPTQDASAVVTGSDLAATVIDLTVGPDLQPADFVAAAPDGGAGG